MNEQDAPRLSLELLRAARAFDNTRDGALTSERIVHDIAVPGEVVAAQAARLVRRVAGHINTPGANRWDVRDDREADATIDGAMMSIHHGGRRPNPNISQPADRAMTALVDLARLRDEDERESLARLYSRSRNPHGIAWVGVQLIRLLCDCTGDAESALDALHPELLEAHAEAPETNAGEPEGDSAADDSSDADGDARGRRRGVREKLSQPEAEADNYFDQLTFTRASSVHVSATPRAEPVTGA